ncbi:MAG: SdrD B-like domain-containing protein [Methanobacterium sp.]
MKKQLGIMLFALVIAICFTGAVSATNGEATDGNCNSNYQLDNNVNLNDGYNTCNNEDKNLNRDNTCNNRDNNWNNNDNTCNNEPKCNTCKNATVGNRVWNDSNANGIQDPSESGIEGITVNLWTNVNNAPGSIINTTTTDANGNYWFKNVIPGAYWLQFLVPDALGEWIFSPQDQGADNTIDSDANAAGIAGPICLHCGECDPNWDAGLYQLAAVGNKVWDDINEDGLQDQNEPGVAGVIVNLWTNVINAPGSIIKTTTTDINGDYMFTNLVPGTYWLQFIPPARVPAWIFTLLMVGNNPAIDNDANATGIAGPIELISGEVDLTWDAGLDTGNAAAGGGDEGNGNAAGGEPGSNELVNAAAGEPSVSAAVVNMQETGLPISYLMMAILMVLGGLFGIKRI